MNTTKMAAVAGVSLTLALSLASCSSGDDTASTDSGTPTAAASATSSSAAPVVDNSDSIVGVASRAGSFSTLVDAWTAANLTEMLSTGEYTVFAPTDSAFKPLVADGTMATLLATPEGKLRDMLRYQIVDGDLKLDDLAKMDGRSLRSVQGQTLKVGASSSGATITLTDQTGKTYEIVSANLSADNGTIHATDGVLMPSS